MTEYLGHVVNCADAACDAARHDERCRSEAVNWGDFRCTAAKRFDTDDGEHGILVLIEEADPNCVFVKQFVADFLKRNGFDDVVVVTAW